MNIFALDHHPARAARMHNDRHVVKMITESCQILSTVLHSRGYVGPIPIYRSTHSHHPCVVWAGEAIGNWRWLVSLLGHLLAEYDYRWGRPGKFRRAREIHRMLGDYEPDLPDGTTPHVQAMPEERRQDDAVNAYRDYYRIDKAHLHQWTRRKTPFFIPCPAVCG